MKVASRRLPREFVLEGKRIRIMEGACSGVCESGITGTQIGDLVREGAVGRAAFYEIFRGKDDCLQQTLAWIGECAYERILEAHAERAIGPRANVRHALAALLDFVAERPILTRFFLVHGPRVSLSVFEESLYDFAELFEPLDLDPLVRDLLVGGIASTIRTHLLQGSAPDLEQLVDFVMGARR